MSMTTDVLEMLAELGETEEAVAAKLTELGCKGMPHSSDDCPAAIYLRQGGVVLFGVDQVEVSLPSGEVDLPGPVADFVEAFDMREYPELIGDGAR